MNVEKMRSALAEVYSSPKWRLRLQQMPDRQIVAIYKNMESRGNLRKHPKKKEPGVTKATQLTIFDFMEDQDGSDTR